MVALLAGLGACGDTVEVITETTVTVEAPVIVVGSEITTMDYELACDERWDAVDDAGLFVPAARRAGSLELVGATPAMEAALPAPSSSWRVILEPVSGSCLLRLIARDEDGDSLCVDAGAFQASAAAGARIRTTLDCNPPTEVSNTTLSVDAPETPGRQIETVSYTIVCTEEGTAFFESVPSLTSDVVMQGILEVMPDGPPGGNVQTELTLPSGQCRIELVPRDADEEVICNVDATFVVRPDRPTDVRLILLCVA